ncbi:MAG: glutathione S-transferase family protein [Myxococcota bacterium]|nr:glutathione S-transferase family protein [Myxococcota bacterium]
MADLRIFSYSPNPRIFKATVAARYCGVDVEVRGARPEELPGWLWDFDARPLTDADRADSSLLREAREGFRGGLYKTDAFLVAHPYGTVPAAFSPDGRIGIFESNSIMRAVARLARNGYPVYGEGPYEASRIDGFLDVSLLFLRESQLFQLAVARDEVTKELYQTTRDALGVYLGGIETALASGPYLVGERVTLADICFTAEIIQFSSTRRGDAKLRGQGFEPLAGEALENAWPRSAEHFRRCAEQPEFAPDLGAYLARIDAA